MFIEYYQLQIFHNELFVSKLKNESLQIINKMKKNKIQLLQKALFLLIFTSISIIGKSTVYYISNSGSDTNNGLSTTTPWKTIDKVNAITFLAGDKILFQRGSTFTGSLIIKRSGISSNPITYSSYGTGENPIFNGISKITEWTSNGNNIWESTSAVSSLTTCNLVMIDNINTPMGRYPNSGATNGGYLQYQTHSGNTSITSSSLTATPNWTGAEAVIKTQHFSIDRSLISSQTAGTLNLKVSTVCTPTDNYGFFIENDIRTLDQQNEWYYNPTTKKLSIYSINKPADVQITTTEKIITVNANNIIIDGLTITGANSYGIFHWQHDAILSNLTIQNCTIKLSGQDGINLWCDKLKIDNNNIYDSNNKGIDISAATNVVLSNNHVENSGVLNGMFQANGAFSAIQIGGNSNTPILVQYNTIINSAHNGMTIGSDKTIVKNNFIDKFCTLIDDGAGVYGGHNAVVTGNIITNGIGNIDGTYGTFPIIAAGVYMDINSSDVEISNNSINKCSIYGIFSNVNSGNITIFGNTVFDCSEAQIRINYQQELRSYGFNVHDNILISKKATQFTAYYNSVVNNIPIAGVFKSNCYARPLDDTKTIQASQPSEYGGKYLKTFNDWKTFVSQEVGSSCSSQKVTNETDFQFIYNNTKTIDSIALPKPMIDVKGTRYVNYVKLQPYTAVVLLVDNAPKIASNKSVTICGSSNYNGWNTSGTYNQKPASATTDSIIVVSLTVNPAYNINDNITIKPGEIYKTWTTTGTYIQTLTTNAGCDSIITTHLTVSETTTSVPDVKEGNETQTIKVFPNPTTGMFTVQFSELPLLASKIEVIDLKGRTVCSREITTTDALFDISSQNSGLYLIRSISSNEEKIFKLLLQK